MRAVASGSSSAWAGTTSCGRTAAPSRRTEHRQLGEPRVQRLPPVADRAAHERVDKLGREVADSPCEAGTRRGDSEQRTVRPFAPG